MGFFRRSIYLSKLIQHGFSCCSLIYSSTALYKSLKSNLSNEISLKSNLSSQIFEIKSLKPNLWNRISQIESLKLNLSIQADISHMLIQTTQKLQYMINKSSFFAQCKKPLLNLRDAILKWANSLIQANYAIK